MKTFSILSILFLSMFFQQPATAAIMAPALENSGITGNLVKAVIFKGVYIPQIDLPQVEIISTKPGTSFEGSFSITEKYMVEVNLPVIEISAKRYETTLLPAFIQNGEVIAISDLPIIEIRDELSLWNLTQAAENGTTPIAIVNLPEIVITPSNSGYFMVSQGGTPDNLMASFDLSAFELSAKYNLLMTLSANGTVFENSNAKWIYMSLKNCGIKLGNKILCEVTSKIDNNNLVMPGTLHLVNQ